MSDKITYEFPTTAMIDDDMTRRLQALAQNSRERSFAATRTPEEIAAGFDPSHPIELRNARITYRRHVHAGAFVVARLTESADDSFLPVGYALALPATETFWSSLIRQARGQLPAANLYEVNVLDTFQDMEFLAGDLAMRAIGRFRSQHKARETLARASEEDTLMQTVLQELDFELSPPDQNPQIDQTMFGPDAPVAELYRYRQRMLSDNY